MAEKLARVMRAESFVSAGFLATGIANEINRPLAGIVACVHSLRDTAEITQEERKELERALDEGLDRIGGSVRGLLQYAIPHAADAIVEEIEVEALVRSRVSGLAPELQHRKLVVDFTEGAWGVIVQGNRERLSQAIDRIFLTVIGHTAPGGRILVATVHDTARTAFVVTAGPAPAPPQKGLPPAGLGLAVAASIFRAHAGELEVIESPGGPTVTVWFPREGHGRP